LPSQAVRDRRAAPLGSPRARRRGGARAGAPEEERMLTAPERLRAANRSSSRRRRAPGAATHATEAERALDARRRAATRRDRLNAALARCSRRDRVVLALMLLERLSASEAADALGISVTRLRRVYGETLAELRLAWTGSSDSSRSRSRRVGVAAVRLRKVV